MRYVAYKIATWKKIGNKSFETERAAKAALTRHLHKEYGHRADIERKDYAVDTQQAYWDNDPIVTTYNCLDPQRKPIEIRLSQKGSVCDPAMEAYHQM